MIVYANRRYTYTMCTYFYRMIGWPEVCKFSSTRRSPTSKQGKRTSKNFCTSKHKYHRLKCFTHHSFRYIFLTVTFVFTLSESLSVTWEFCLQRVITRISIPCRNKILSPMFRFFWHVLRHTLPTSPTNRSVRQTQRMSM